MEPNQFQLAKKGRNVGWRQNRGERASPQEMRPSPGGRRGLPHGNRHREVGREPRPRGQWGLPGDLAIPPLMVHLFIHKLCFSKPEMDRYCMIPLKARSLEEANP